MIPPSSQNKMHFLLLNTLQNRCIQQRIGIENQYLHDRPYSTESCSEVSGNWSLLAPHGFSSAGFVGVVIRRSFILLLMA